jgi:hypothetical protein
LARCWRADKTYEEIELLDESLDFESKLVFLIMRKASLSLTDFPAKILNFEQFKRSYKGEMKATGQVLEWLGLAKCDKAAPLGWRSMVRLQYALVMRGSIPEEVRRTSTREEERLFEAIYQGALGDGVSDETYLFVTKQLVGCGLAQTYVDDYFHT